MNILSLNKKELNNLRNRFYLIASKSKVRKNKRKLRNPLINKKIQPLIQPSTYVKYEDIGEENLGNELCGGSADNYGIGIT